MTPWNELNWLERLAVGLFYGKQRYERERYQRFHSDLDLTLSRIRMGPKK